MFCLGFVYFSVQKALDYYTLNKSHPNSFILFVFTHVVNFRFYISYSRSSKFLHLGLTQQR